MFWGDLGSSCRAGVILSLFISSCGRMFQGKKKKRKREKQLSQTQSQQQIQEAEGESWAGVPRRTRAVRSLIENFGGFGDFPSYSP